MYSGGIGFFIDMFGSSNAALRAEYRLRGDDALGPTLHDDIISLGLQIPFGRADRPVTDSDSTAFRMVWIVVPEPAPVWRSMSSAAMRIATATVFTDANDQCPSTAPGATSTHAGASVMTTAMV